MARCALDSNEHRPRCAMIEMGRVLATASGLDDVLETGNGGSLPDFEKHGLNAIVYSPVTLKYSPFSLPVLLKSAWSRR